MDAPTVVNVRGTTLVEKKKNRSIPMRVDRTRSGFAVDITSSSSAREITGKVPFRNGLIHSISAVLPTPQGIMLEGLVQPLRLVFGIRKIRSTT